MARVTTHLEKASDVKRKKKKATCFKQRLCRKTEILKKEHLFLGEIRYSTYDIKQQEAIQIKYLKDKIRLFGN